MKSLLSWVSDFFTKQLYERGATYRESAKPLSTTERIRSLPGQELTDEEREFVERALCPDCEVGQLMGGPSGGAAVNMKCAACDSKYNICFFFGRLAFAERL